MKSEYLTYRKVYKEVRLLTYMKKGKKLGLDPVLTLIKEGSSPAQISKKLNAPKQTIDYYVGKLKDMGCIEKVGYGTWKFIKDLKEVPIRPKATSKPKKSDLSGKKEIRGHAFIWKISFIEPLNWDLAVSRYKKKKLTFQMICRGTVHRTLFKDRKIWLTKDGLVIYEAMDFFGKSSFSVKGTAVYQMDQIVKQLLKELGLRERPYNFTTSREHYAIIKNQLAKQYNDRKEKMIIRGEDGSPWLWIDHSKGEHELETDEPLVNRQVQRHWNSHKKHKFKHDADYIEGMDQKVKGHDQTLNKSMAVLEGYAEQIQLHLKVEKKQLINLEKQDQHFKEQNEHIKQQTEIFKKILEKLS